MAVDGDGGSEILERNSSSISQPPRAITIEPGNDSFEGTNAALPKCNDTFVIKIPLLIPFVQSTVNPRLKSRVNCLSCITASLCSGSLDLVFHDTSPNSSSRNLRKLPYTSSKARPPAASASRPRHSRTRASKKSSLHRAVVVRFMSQRVSITNAFADPRSPTETSLAPAWAATRCAHGTPVVPNQCLKSSSSLGGKVCVLMSCASSATLLSPNGRSGPLLGRFASFSTAPLLQSCRLALAELEQLDES
uniref:Uncharacterized protein n=1 Tax=Pyricularia oryzae (strain P131) TaxID=1143193 RepID=L7ITL6_PYRO1